MQTITFETGTDSQKYLVQTLTFAIKQTHRTYDEQVALYSVADDIDYALSGEWAELGITEPKRHTEIVEGTWKTTECSECQRPIHVTDSFDFDGTQMCDSCSAVFE